MELSGDADELKEDLENEFISWIANPITNIRPDVISLIHLGWNQNHKFQIGSKRITPLKHAFELNSLQAVKLLIDFNVSLTEDSIIYAIE